MEAPWPGHAYRLGPAPRPARSLGFVLLGVFLTGMLVLAVVLVSAGAALLAPRPAQTCTQRCGPSTITPIPPPKIYRSSALGYEVAYAAGWSVSQQDAAGAVFQTALGGFFVIRGQRAGTSEAQLVQAMVSSLPASQFQSVQPLHPVRGAQIGFQDGVGTIYSANFTPSGGRAIKTRIAVEAATRGGLAISAMGVDPYDSHRSSGIPEDVSFDYVLSQVTWPNG